MSVIEQKGGPNMTKGLHKNSIRKVDNPHQWMIDDARMELIQQIKAEILRLIETDGAQVAIGKVLTILDTLKEQPVMIEWTGNNLKEVIEFTGKSPRFDEWFKTWEEYESYVHSHGNIFKLFNEDGTHLEIPVGAWIFKTPDGRNVPSTFLYQEQPVCEDLKKRVSEIYPNKEGDLYSLHSTLQRGGYIRGYQDCKEEMMKEAVEGEVIPLKSSMEILIPNLTNNTYKVGDKVRIVIIKED